MLVVGFDTDATYADMLDSAFVVTVACLESNLKYDCLEDFVKRL